MKEFSNFESVEKALNAAAGVMSVAMAQLRDACGAGRLGIHVRASISDELERRGIGYQPVDLPTNQFDQVRLYRRGTPASDVIEAAQAIGNNAADETLRRLQRPNLGNDEGSVERPRVHRGDPMRDLICSLDRAESKQGHHFVALKWFRDVALVAEEFDWSRTVGGRDALVRDAIDRGIVLTGKVPNPRKPEFPVTSIRLNRTAQEVQAALRTPYKDATFQPIAIRGETLSSTVLRDRR